jgi:cell division protein FtsB
MRIRGADHEWDGRGADHERDGRGADHAWPVAERIVSERRGLGLGGFLALCALVLLVVAALGLLPYRQVLAQERAVELSQSKLDALVEENLRLEQLVAVLETDEEVERLAREQFGLVKPGEVGYVAVVPDGIVDPLPPQGPTELEGNEPWWRRFWDFLTGRDVAPNG